VKSTATLFILVLFFVGGFFVYKAYVNSEEIIIIYVDDKEVEVWYGEDGVEYNYYIHADNETFKILNFNFIQSKPPDIYSKLKVGRTYEVGVRGWHFPYLLYRNVSLFYREIRPRKGVDHES
jgi:hypothetical protein